ncbi:Protein bli-3 [Paramyrothecium foliicola]|nr:Protein bli-3 [Paramyrothecium foliicola]
MSFSNTSTGDKQADPYKAKTLEEPDLKTKVNDLVEFITKSKYGMMTTKEADSDKLVSRCMALAATEAGGLDLLFHTNTESGKTNDLASDSHINMSFLNSSGEWASVSGTASVITDRDLVKKHYSATLKSWVGDLGDGVHDGSENDPRIGIIRVKTVTATYSLVAKGFLARAADIAQGAVTGNTASPNSLREISESEIQQWRSAQAMNDE